jgi:hypothetical protein
MPSPFAGDTTHGGPITVLGDALRRLAERVDWTTVGELAREMDQRRPSRLLKVLKLAWFLDIDGSTVFDGILMIDVADGLRPRRNGPLSEQLIPVAGIIWLLSTPMPSYASPTLFCQR